MPNSDDIQKQGYAGPYPLLEKDERTRLLSTEHILSNLLLPTVKQRHVTSQTIASIALKKEILEKIKPLLGDNILLSGSQVINQLPNSVHEWHVDVEHTEWNGLTVWIGLGNVKRKECIRVISQSHKFNITPDDLKKRGVDIYNDDEVLAYAKTLSPDAELIEIDIADGEFFIFDGLTWHASRNISTLKRHALILQYCNTQQKVKSLKSELLPKVIWDKSYPECLLVNGTDEPRVNKVITINKVGAYNRKLKNLLFYLPKNLITKSPKIAALAISYFSELF